MFMVLCVVQNVQNTQFNYSACQRYSNCVIDCRVGVRWKMQKKKNLFKMIAWDFPTFMHFVYELCILISGTQKWTSFLFSLILNGRLANSCIELSNINWCPLEAPLPPQFLISNFLAGVLVLTKFSSWKDALTRLSHFPSW